MAGVITASEPTWIAPFTGLSPRQFAKLVTMLRREGTDAVGRGQPWNLTLEDRALRVAVYWRTNLTMRQLAPLFGVSKSAAGRIIDHRGPTLALRPRKRSPKTPCSSWTAPWCPPAITPCLSSPKATGTPPTIRSSSMPIPG
jgi:hypothetical protein